MSQSRIDSLMESVVNIGVGLVISMTANQIFIPMMTGSPLRAADNAALAVIYTIISLARRYVIRRAFNGKSIWQSMKGVFND